MRTKKVLLVMLRDYTKTEQAYCGMCASIHEMYNDVIITGKECAKLDLFIEKNRPKKGIHFCIVMKDESYWFPFGDKQPRIDWLNYKISQL